MRDTIDNNACKKETITIFIIPTRNKKYKKLIQFMKITPEWAERLLARSLNNIKN